MASKQSTSAVAVVEGRAGTPVQSLTDVTDVIVRTLGADLLSLGDRMFAVWDYWHRNREAFPGKSGKPSRRAYAEALAGKLGNVPGAPSIGALDKYAEAGDWAHAQGLAVTPAILAGARRLFETGANAARGPVAAILSGESAPSEPRAILEAVSAEVDKVKASRERKPLSISDFEARVLKLAGEVAAGDRSKIGAALLRIKKSLS